VPAGTRHSVTPWAVVVTRPKTRLPTTVQQAPQAKPGQDRRILTVRPVLLVRQVRQPPTGKQARQPHPDKLAQPNRQIHTVRRAPPRNRVQRQNATEPLREVVTKAIKVIKATKTRMKTAILAAMALPINRPILANRRLSQHPVLRAAVMERPAAAHSLAAMRVNRALPDSPALRANRALTDKLAVPVNRVVPDNRARLLPTRHPAIRTPPSSPILWWAITAPTP
jgi:hypothetical protein